MTHAKYHYHQPSPMLKHVWTHPRLFWFVSYSWAQINSKHPLVLIAV